MLQGIYSLLWLTNTGEVDTTRIHRSSTYPIKTFAEMPTGQFICYTYSAGLVEGIPSERIFRLQPDGALDTTFHAPLIDHEQVNNFHPLEDGKILVAGRFVLAGIPDTLCWARLLPSGALDTTFNNLMSFQEHYPYENTIPVVSNFFRLGPDKMIVLGNFDEIGGISPYGGIAMVDTAGLLLTEYFNGGGCGVFYNPVFDVGTASIAGITTAPDGSYYIYGAYKGYNDGTTNDTLQGFVSRLYGLNVGIHEQQENQPQPLKVAPNPSAGSTVFSTPAPLTNTVLYIHDGSGRLVWQAAWPAGAERYTLPAGALAPGAYVVRVSHAGSAARDPARTPAYTGRLVVMP